MKHKTKHIVLAFDNNIDYVYVLIVNIVRTSKSPNILFFHLFIPENLNNKLLEDYLIKDEINFKFYFISSGVLSGFKIDRSFYNHITDTAFYRLLIGDLLDSSIHNSLYIDTDVFLRAPIEEIFEELSLEKTLTIASIGPNNSFNSGVILFNLDLYRKKFNLLTALEVYQRNNFKGDEELLNFLFNSDVNRVSIQWNFPIQSYSFYKKYYNYFGYTEDVKLVHFVGTSKPWRYSTSSLYADEWLKLYRELFNKNPWIKVSATERLKKMINKSGINPMTMINIFKLRR
jgi:lipopolysaccharide biosynthesis glycosyltransferase